MRPRYVAVLSLSAAFLSACVWIMGGDAWAARREGKSEFAWNAAFGRLEDLKKKYPKLETNEAAKRLEELGHGTVFDLTSVAESIEPKEMRLDEEWKQSQGTVDFLLAQIARPEASIDSPPEDAIRFLEERRGALDAIESLLVAGPPPVWAFDPSLPENDRKKPNFLGHIRIQRILMARALSAARGGRSEAAASSLEASWNLNESLRGRPETVSGLIAVAVARLQVGVLRKVSVDERLWKERLKNLDPRRPLLDALVLDARLNSSRNWWRDFFRNAGHSPWYKRARDLFASPMERVVDVEISNTVRDELSRLRGSALSEPLTEPPAPPRGSPAQIIASISMPNIRNTFLRADRLVVDAELTSKVLEAKQLRKENGMRWPAAIPGIETSRFPGASWRYEATPDGRMSIAFSRELASPYGGPLKSLPLRFSSN